MLNSSEHEIYTAHISKCLCLLAFKYLLAGKISSSALYIKFLELKYLFNIYLQEIYFKSTWDYFQIAVTNS